MESDFQLKTIGFQSQGVYDILPSCNTACVINESSRARKIGENYDQWLKKDKWEKIRMQKHMVT